MTSNSESPTTPITIGTAGHIDHGKTLLVERLTGMRADRPYERDRGMTIDIGYAEMTASDGQRIGFVDLPGHERFIRNMVAGATGIDLALLVVAADDGVMPQTREHVEILGLLGVDRGLVVLNKTDLVEPDLRELALEELSEFLEGTCLADAPILSCSAATGDGVEPIRDALLELVSGTRRAEHPGAFFLAVQRSFAATGFGCIVTGVPAAGHIAVGDEVEVLPAGKKARVRSIEIYHSTATEAVAGHRTALNLSGVHHEELGRGAVIATPGAYRTSRHLAAELALLPSARLPVKHAGSVRVLTGTLEEMASVYLLEGDALGPGQSALVEIRCREPVTVRDGAAFIVRSDNAKETLGGGHIVGSLERPIGRKSKTLHAELREWSDALGDPERMLETLLAFEHSATATTLARRAQLTREAATAILERMRGEGRLLTLSSGAYAPADAVQRASESLLAALADMHAEQPLLAALPIAEVRDRAGLDEATLSAALALVAEEVVQEARTLRLASHRVTLDEGIQQAADRLMETLRAARFAPPARPALADATGLAAKEVERALTLLLDRKALREVTSGVFYPSETLDEGLRLLRRVAEQRGSFEPVDAKAVLGGISRKWMIPLLEYYDRLGATRRDGNARLLTRRGETMAEKGIAAAG